MIHWGLGVTNLLALAFFLVAAAFFVRLIREHRAGLEPSRHLLWGTAFAGLAASFSFGTGLGVWPALLLVAVGARLPARRWLFLLLPAILCGLAYLGGGDTTGLSGERLLGVVRSRPVAFPEFWAAFVGSGVGHLAWHLGMVSWKGVHGVSVGAGTVGLLVLAVTLGVLAVRPASASSGRLLAVCLMALPSASSLLASLVRVGYFAPQTASTDRFVLWSALFWMGVSFVLADVLAKQRASSVLPRAAGLLLVILAPALLAASTSAAAWRVRRAAALEESTVALLLGVRHEPSTARLYHDPHTVYRVTDRLRRDGKNLFASARARLPGSALTDHFDAVEGERCEGRTAPLRPAERAAAPAATAMGWARDRLHDVPPQAILLTDADGTIRGIGSFTRRRRGDERGSGWFGWIADFAPGTTYDAWAVIEEGRVCSLPPTSAASPQEAPAPGTGT